MDVKQENYSSSNENKRNDLETTSCKEKEEVQISIKREDKSCKTSSPKMENPRICKEDDELDSAKSEIGEMKEENERLKQMLEQIENDYRALQMRFFDIVQHEQPQTILSNKSQSLPNETQEEESEISLTLGIQNPIKRKREDSGNTSSRARDCSELMSEGLSLGLEIRSPSKVDLIDVGSERSNETEDAKDDEVGETSPQNKSLKTTDNNAKEEDCGQSNTAKRARVSVRVRCDTPTMNDGCHWRKYGQKIAKGNPCPRAYYRCTVAPACPVRKQVQRCSEDMSILITTYEGTHNHPLPAAATAMASTTSAAASILLSGPTTSSQGLSSSAPLTTTGNLNGLNFTLYNNSKPGQFNLPGSSATTPPTITLDLTASSSSQFTRRFSSNFIPKHRHSRSLDFSSSEANTFPTAWSSTSFLNYSSFPSNKSPMGSISFGKPSQEQLTHPYMERISQSAASTSSTSQQFLTETLTRVLTSNPSFQSAVAAAISTMVGSSNNIATNTNFINLESLASNLEWGEVSGISINSLPQNGNACAPSYINRPTAASSSQAAGSFMLLQPPFPFSLSKSPSSSNLRDHYK